MKKITTIPASTIASILIFAGAGYFAFEDILKQFSNNSGVLIAVFGAFSFSAIYYFAVEIFAETNQVVRLKIESAPRLEWWIRVANQTLLFSLWLLLEKDINYFFYGIISLYGSFLLWNYVVRKFYRDNYLLVFDFVGFILSIVFWWLTSKNLILNQTEALNKNELDEISVFLWGLVFIAYLVNSIVAILYLIKTHNKNLQELKDAE